MEIIIKIILYIYIMPPKYKTCSTVFQRQGLDAGHGRITVPSNYGKGNTDNDSCGEVYAPHDCPSGYKLLSGNTPYHDHGRVRTAGTAVSDSVLKSKMCWRGGNTSGRGSQAILGMSHGIHGSYYVKSNEGSGSNNYGKVCFKDGWGWSRTNPINGNKSNINIEDNINACCGFKDSVRMSVQEKYCNPDHCFKKNSAEYSISNPDEITKKCADQLLKNCKKWSFVNDLIGFEDDRCSDPIGQISKDTGTRRDKLSDHHLGKEINYSASIQRSEYSKIGNDLCKIDDFLNSGSKNDIKKKKNKKCLQWCKDNSDTCAPKMTEVCKTIYDRVKKYPDVFSDDLKNFEGICACNWPQEFYDNIIDYYIKTYNVTAGEVGTRRKCLFKPCGSSNIKHVDPLASDDTCLPTNFTSCIQNLNIDFTGSQIEGEVNVDAGQSQSCGTFADSGAGGSGSGGDSEGGPGKTSEVSNPGGGDTTFIVVMVVIVILVIALIAGGVIIIKK